MRGPPPLSEAGRGGAGGRVDKLEPHGRLHGDFHRPRLFRVGKPFLLLCGGESWGGSGAGDGRGAPSSLLGAMITPLAATIARSTTAATTDTGSGVISTLGVGGGRTGLRGGGGGGGRGGGSGSTGVPGRRGSKALRASLSLVSPCRRVPASSRMALAVSCCARRKSREESEAEGMGGGSAGGRGLGGEGATWTCWGGGGGGAGGGGDKARQGSWTVCRAGGGEDSRSLGGGQPPSWGLQEGRAQGSGLLEPPLLWAGVSVDREM